MKPSDSGMYVVADEELGWIALVYCTILTDGTREHGWFSSGSCDTTKEAIDKLQEEMRKD